MPSLKAERRIRPGSREGLAAARGWLPARAVRPLGVGGGEPQILSGTPIRLYPKTTMITVLEIRLSTYTNDYEYPKPNFHPSPKNLADCGCKNPRTNIASKLAP